MNVGYTSSWNPTARVGGRLWGRGPTWGPFQEKGTFGSLYSKGRNEATHRKKTINAHLSAILYFQSIFYGSCFVQFLLVKTTLHKSLSGLPTRPSAFPGSGLAGTGHNPSVLLQAMSTASRDSTFKVTSSPALGCKKGTPFHLAGLLYSCRWR